VAVVDCGYGCQKRTQKEDHQAEADFRQEGKSSAKGCSEETACEEGTLQEKGGDESRSEKISFASRRPSEENTEREDYAIT
jgi:hypothetical protein